MKLLLSILFCLGAASNAASLGSYNIDSSKITVSGFSSGAFMAVQMHVAFSATFSGAASVAGGAYWCAQGSSITAETTCMSFPQSIEVSNLVSQANTLAAQGLIDPVSNLKNAPIYIYASPTDTVVNPQNSDKLQQFYDAFLPDAQITTVHSVNSAHGMPTLSNGIACSLPSTPWILDCNYDAAGELLKTLYGTLQPRGNSVASNLIEFDQTQFGDANTPLYPHGWVYVPTQCANGAKCGLHVVLHGCQQTPDDIQDQFATQTGYNEWAETNNLIVLYPQSNKLGTSNPFGCWDWYGFTGSNYVTKQGAQMSALKSMVDKVQGL